MVVLKHSSTPRSDVKWSDATAQSAWAKAGHDIDEDMDEIVAERSRSKTSIGNGD